MKKYLKIVLIFLFSLIITLFFIRLILPKEIDDINPGIPCPELEKYNPDILYVIPLFNNQSISENTEWCKEILAMNKSLGLHGIKHTYREFELKSISQEELEGGINAFEECFGFEPTVFKAPQLKISKQNKKLIRKNNLILKGVFNQFIHKVYHCDDSGSILHNGFINIF